MRQYFSVLLAFSGVLFFSSCDSTQGSSGGSGEGSDTVVAKVVAKTAGQPAASTDTALPYWNPEMSRTGTEGYIDTFSVDSHLFRIVHHTDEDDGIFQKWQENGWHTIAEFVQIGNHNSYERETDVNHDGFIDVLSTFKWDAHLYLYNPGIQSFSSKPIENFSTEWTVLDSTKKIYCCVQESKWASGYSDLYQFNGMQKVVLYRVGFIAQKEDQQVLDKVVLYKVNHNNTEDLTEVERIPVSSEVSDFAYADYWKEHYKQLLHL